MIQSFFSLFLHTLHLPQKELFFSQCGDSSCTCALCRLCWVIEIHLLMRDCYIQTNNLSCLLLPALPVGSDIPLLAQVSVLLFKHTPRSPVLLQHRPALGDPTAISGTLKSSSLFHQTCDQGQDRQACSNPTPQSLWTQPWHLTGFTTHQCCHLYIYCYSPWHLTGFTTHQGCPLWTHSYSGPMPMEKKMRGMFKHMNGKKVACDLCFLFSS